MSGAFGYWTSWSSACQSGRLTVSWAGVSAAAWRLQRQADRPAGRLTGAVENHTRTFWIRLEKISSFNCLPSQVKNGEITCPISGARRVNLPAISQLHSSSCFLHPVSLTRIALLSSSQHLSSCCYFLLQSERSSEASVTYQLSYLAGISLSLCTKTLVIIRDAQ